MYNKNIIGNQKLKKYLLKAKNKNKNFIGVKNIFNPKKKKINF